MEIVNRRAGLRAGALSRNGARCKIVRLLMIKLLISLNCVAANAADERMFYMGFTPWLYDFSVEAIDSTYSYINSHSDVIAHHLEEGVPWTEARTRTGYHPNMMWGWNLRKIKSSRDLKVFVSISPLNQSRSGLAEYRGESTEMALPTRFQGRSFNDPIVKLAYLNYAESVIRFFEPDYLAIAIEANELYFNNRAQWPDFVELYIETYAALKLRHPELPIFFTTSLHNMNQMRKDTDDAWREMSMLWNYADIAAFSYYPFMEYPLNSNDPVAMMDKIRAHTDKPLAISESGYPAQPIDYPGLSYIPTTERLQGEIMFRMLNKVYRDQYEFFIAWTYRDFDQLMNRTNMPAISALWRDTGLLSETGKRRLSSEVWDAFYNLPTR